MKHTCMTDFWGDWADALSASLDLVAWGDALQMRWATYSALVAVQQAIERAANVTATKIPMYEGGGTPYPDEDLLYNAAQAFLSQLRNDEWDTGGGHHTSHAVGWIMTPVPPPPNVGPEDGALTALRGVMIGPPGPPPGGLLGRVRNALGE